MFTSIIFGLFTSLCAYALSYVAILTVKKVSSWIRKKGETASKNEVGFMMKEKMKSGEYKVVTGVFNKKTDEVNEYEAFRASSLDYYLAKENDLVIYN